MLLLLVAGDCYLNKGFANEERYRDIETIDSPELGNVGRRKALKTIVGGVTALAAYNVLPSKWGTPIIEQIFLPAHAATSGAIIASLTVNSKNAADDTCVRAAKTVNITGTVSATDGRDLAGVEVNILYTDDPVEAAYADRVVIVQAGNIFSLSELVSADDGSWSGEPYVIVVTFVDQATYGTGSASTAGECGQI